MPFPILKEYLNMADYTTAGNNASPNLKDTQTNTDETSKRRAEINNKYYTKIEAMLNDLYLKAMEQTYRSFGAGTYINQLQNNMTNIDRFGVKAITYNNVHSGMLFMTRPHLNLSSINLRQNRFMHLLNTMDPVSLQFAIRLWLDVPMSKDTDLRESVKSCLNFTRKSPWFIPLMNNITDVSGFPSQVIETYTDEGGFFSESQSFAIGSDRNRKPFDLQLTFTEPLGGICMAILQFWLEYIAALTIGEMVAYPWHIDRQVINYTVSIYRFILDPSKQYIQKWSKCTGCFPTARPGGACFDISRNEDFVEAAKTFSTTFRCNIYEENDPIILKEFNMLAERYWPELKYLDPTSAMVLSGNTYKVERGLEQGRLKQISNLVKCDNRPEDNYKGLPYITFTSKGPLLGFYREAGEGVDGLKVSLKEQAEQLNATIQQYYNIIDQLDGNYLTIKNLPGTELI